MKVSDLDPKHLDIEVSASSGDIWISGGEIEEARPTKKRLNLGFPVIGVFSSSKSGLRRHQFKTYPADHFTGRRGEHTVQDYFKMRENIYFQIKNKHIFEINQSWFMLVSIVKAFMQFSHILIRIKRLLPVVETTLVLKCLTISSDGMKFIPDRHPMVGQDYPLVNTKFMKTILLVVVELGTRRTNVRHM